MSDDNGQSDDFPFPNLSACDKALRRVVAWWIVTYNLNAETAVSHVLDILDEFEAQGFSLSFKEPHNDADLAVDFRPDIASGQSPR